MRTHIVFLAFALFAACAMVEGKVEPLALVTKSTENFSTNVFKKISSENKGKNLVCSPLSVHVVLSMAAYGAGGNTAKQMREALYLPADDVAARQGFENLIDQLNNVEKVTLEVGNKIFVSKDFVVKSEFKQLTTGTFRSEASQLDVSQPKESAQVVNNWVDEKTHHKINKILEESDITSDTRMLLLNAVYFKGKWATPFKAALTSDETFHLDDKTEKQVPTMYSESTYVYGELPDLKAKFIELPYENKDLKMIVIVPDEINGLSSILDNLESFNHTRLAAAGSEREVQLQLPKFKIESTIDLEKPLEALGMTDMFRNGANFSSIADEPLKVGKVLQKAYIEVNEEGSEAAAVTVSGIMVFSIPVTYELIVDRPFYFEIIKQANDQVPVTLFSGAIKTF